MYQNLSPKLDAWTLTQGSNWPIIDSCGKPAVAQAVIFGLGSMFNHSTQEQNVGWIRDTKRLVITYRSLHDIAVGEELCKNNAPPSLIISEADKEGISYGSHLTFEDADKPPITPPEEEIEQLRMIQPY